MGAGKILCILGGIVTLVSTFLLSLFSLDFPTDLLWLEAGDVYASGLGFFVHIGDAFSNVEDIATGFGTESYVVWIFLILLIFWAISGIIQLIGVKSRVAGIIGSIMPIFVGLVIILWALEVFDFPDEFGVMNLLLTDNTQLAGVIPFDLPFGDFSLGAILMIAGGGLGLVGGILGPEDF